MAQYLHLDFFIILAHSGRKDVSGREVSEVWKGEREVEGEGDGWVEASWRKRGRVVERKTN